MGIRCDASSSTARKRPSHGRLWRANEETLLRETTHRLRLGVGNFEYSEQPGHLQQFIGSRSEVAEPQRGSAGFRAGMHGDQRAEPRAVDHRDIFQIEDELLFALTEEALHFFAQSNSLFSEYNASVQGQYCHSIHFAVCNFQSHVCSPSLTENDCSGSRGRPAKHTSQGFRRIPRTGGEYTPIPLPSVLEGLQGRPTFLPRSASARVRRGPVAQASACVVLISVDAEQHTPCVVC